MTTKVIVTGGTSSSSPELFTAADDGVSVYGASSGYQMVIINSGITGVQLDANIEEISLPGNLSSYTFQAVSGSGLQIKSGGNVVATLGSINQNVKINFADFLAATLEQTSSTAFKLNGVITLSTSDVSGITSSQLGLTTSLTAAQATADLNFGIHFGPTQDVTITGSGTDLAGLASLVYALGGKSITLDASDNAVSLTLNQASDTIAFGGVKFKGGDSSVRDVVTVGMDDGTNNNNNVPISLAAALVDIGQSGTWITLDQSVPMSNANTNSGVVSGGSNTSTVDTSGEWSFNNSTDVLTYWSGSAKTITLVGVSSVSVSGGDMTMTLG